MREVEASTRTGGRGRPHYIAISRLFLAEIYTEWCGRLARKSLRIPVGADYNDLVQIYLGIGSNLGDRLKNLNDCMKEFSVVQKSSIYETEPVAFLDQPWFLNAVLQIDSTQSPGELLAFCQSIENKFGRKREIPKGPRTLDIDILFFNQTVVQEADLVIPHPEIQNRKFVLAPMNEIAPNFEHPTLHKTISELLRICEDPSVVRAF